MFCFFHFLNLEWTAVIGAHKFSLLKNRNMISRSNKNFFGGQYYFILSFDFILRVWAFANLCGKIISLWEIQSLSSNVCIHISKNPQNPNVHQYINIYQLCRNNCGIFIQRNTTYTRNAHHNMNKSWNNFAEWKKPGKNPCVLFI